MAASFALFHSPSSSLSTTRIPALLACFPAGFSLLFGYRSPRFPRSSPPFLPLRMPSLMSAPCTAQTTRPACLPAPACRHFSVVARAMLNARKIDSDEVTPAGRFRESISREALSPRTRSLLLLMLAPRFFFPGFYAFSCRNCRAPTLHTFPCR